MNLFKSRYGRVCASSIITGIIVVSLILTPSLIQEVVAPSPYVVKWSASGLYATLCGVLIADINGDGQEEVIHCGGTATGTTGNVTALRASDGKVLWRTVVPGMGDWSKIQMADLNNDGNLEIVVPLITTGIHVLFAGNGSTYWRTPNVGGHTYSSIVVVDGDLDGYPEIYIGSEDVGQELNGKAYISCLSHDGRILHQTWNWRTCGGGVSAADGDNDGRIEIYSGDRDCYMGDGDWGRGIRSFWADDLTPRWNHYDILCSSQAPILADVNKDGVLDVIVSDQRAGLFVLDSRTGSAIREGRGLGLPSHYEMSVYDIDGDGNLEALMADGEHSLSYPNYSDVVIFDLVKWQVDGRINVGACRFGPQVADVTGDGVMDIIACASKGVYIISYQPDTKTYAIVGQVTTGLSSTLNYAVVQDIDADGLNEIVVNTDHGRVYAIDTPGIPSSPRARSEIQWYSERRNGAAEYVPRPDQGSKTPASLLQYSAEYASLADWWNSNWPYRKAIVIDHNEVVGDQTSFPVLIDNTDSELIGDTQSDGGDIVFTDSGGTKLSHEIELYNFGSGHLVCWVNVPALSSTADTTLYMYYGNKAVENQGDPHSVWDSDFMMVQHLEESSGSVNDSTDNGNNGTPYGVAMNTDGKIDGADGFSGTNSYIRVPSSSSISGFSVAFTASFWVNFHDASRRQSILQKFNTAGNQRGWMIEYDPAYGGLRFWLSPDGASYQDWRASFNPVTGAWYCIAVVWQANTIPMFYINGVLVSTIRTGRVSSIFDNSATVLEIGRNTYAPSGKYFDGIIDEVCISDTNRLVGWISTCYNNQGSPSSFCTVGPEVSNNPSTGPTTDPYLNVDGQGNLVCVGNSTGEVTSIYNWHRSSWFETNVSLTNLLLPFDTSDQTVAKDYSGYGNDGQVIGATWTSGGKVGGAYVFDGNISKASYIRVPNNPSLGGDGTWSEITVEAWIYLTQNQKGTRIIDKIPSYEIGFREGSNNMLFAGVWTNGSSQREADCPTPLTINTWYHVAFTYKDWFYTNGSGLITLYVNGDPVASRLHSGAIKASIESLYIGWYDFFKGKIDDVRVYPISLAAQQIRQRYLETRDGSSDNSMLVAEEALGGYTYQCEVTPNDGSQDGSSKFSNSTYVTNNPPTAGNLMILPRAQTWALDTDDLTASYIYSDVDGQPESGTQIRWYKNNNLQSGLNDLLTVPASLTTIGDKWNFTVRPRDGIDFGTTVASYTVTIIANSPPTQDQPRLVSSGGTNTTSEDLICTPQGTSDGDGDAVRSIYNWKVNGQPTANLLLTFDTENVITAKDYSGYGNNAAIHGPIRSDGEELRSITWTDQGRVGGAYVFDGNDFMTVADVASLGGGGTWSALTIEFWIKPAVLQNGARLISKTIPGQSVGTYTVGYQTSGPKNQLFFDITDANGDTWEVVDTGTLAVNTWYHIVCTYKSGSGLTLYVNGVPHVSLAVSGFIKDATSKPAGDEPLFIGSNGGRDLSRYLIGTLDEVAIYHIALTPEQVAQRYNESRNGQSTTSTIVYTQTSTGEIWTCEVTPNDSYQDGVPKTSNPITILP